MTRYIRWQILLIILGVVLVGVLLTYLAVNYTTVLRPGHGGTYVEGIVGFPRHLNPLLNGYNEADRDVCSLVFSGLTRLNERGEVEPDLARDWEISPDGLDYTFYLRSDAFWHDGTPVTAEDVAFTVELLQDPDFPGPPNLGASVWRTVKVRTIDRRTVRFTLPEPYAPFLDYTTVGILPFHILAGTSATDLPDSDFNISPVGSGPFQVEEIEVENGTITSMVLKQSSRYFGKKPYLDRVQFRFYPSHQSVLDAYEAGEVDGVAVIRPDDLSQAYNLDDLNLYSAQLAEYGIVFLNLNRPDDLPFFQSPEVRRALMYALNRQRVIDDVLEGQGMVVDSPVIPGTWAYSSQASDYAYDLDQANELLDSVGWEQAADDGVRTKDGQRLAFNLITSNDSERAQTAHLLSDQWASVGITVTVETVSPLELRDALESRQFDAILAHLRLPGDPDPYPFWHETQIDKGQNYAGLDHRRISEVIEQARVTVNQRRRYELYEEFQQLFAEQMPSLLLYVPVYTYGVGGRVNDVQIGPLMYPADRFRTISDWWIVHRRVFVSEAEAVGLDND